MLICASHSWVRLKKRVTSSPAYPEPIPLVYEKGSGTVKARVSSVCCPVFRCSQMSVSRISPENQDMNRTAVSANSRGRSHRGRGAETGGLTLRRGMERAATDLLVEPVDIRIGFRIPAHIEFQPLPPTGQIAQPRVQ